MRLSKAYERLDEVHSTSSMGVVLVDGMYISERLDEPNMYNVTDTAEVRRYQNSGISKEEAWLKATHEMDKLAVAIMLVAYTPHELQTF